MSKQGFGSKNDISGVLGFSWTRFWCSWCPLGCTFGALGGSRWHPEFAKNFIWVPLSHHFAPRGTLDKPKQLPKRPHGEADGPTKPPRPIWKRILIYVLLILNPKSMKPFLESHNVLHMLSTHGSAAASAKRTEIRRAAPACMELPNAS